MSDRKKGKKDRIALKERQYCKERELKRKDERGSICKYFRQHCA
jgi:hypothetical protein